MNTLPWKKHPPDNMGVIVRLCDATQLSPMLILREEVPQTIIFGTRKIKYLHITDLKGKRRLGELFNTSEEQKYGLSDIIFAISTKFEGDSHWLKLRRHLESDTKINKADDI